MRDNIVSFDKSASFWLTAARRCARKIEWREAVRYYLLALEKEKNPKTVTELAWAYTRLGCYETADRLLFQVLLEDNTFGDAYYVLGMSAYDQLHEDLCMCALDKFLRLCPQSPKAQDAHDLLAETEWTQPPLPAKRGNRALCLCDRAKRCDDFNKRDELLKKAVRLDPSGVSLLTSCLFMLPGSPLKALILWKKAKRKGLKKEHRLTFCLMGGLLYYLLKDPKKSRRCLYRASLLVKGRDQEDWFCATALDCRQMDLAENFALKKLNRMPWAVPYMHYMRLALTLKGKAAEAAKWRKRILSVDPDDPCLTAPKNIQVSFFSHEKMMMQSILRMMCVRKERLRTGVLNRLTHVICLAMRDDVSIDNVFKFVPPMYQNLRPLTKKRIEGSAWREWHTAFTLCLLNRVGQKEYAHELFESSPRKQRILRCVGRIERGMKHSSFPRILK